MRSVLGRQKTDFWRHGWPDVSHSDAAHQGNHIIIFPELALSGYECSEEAATEKKSCRMHTELAEAIPGPSTEEMGQHIAAKCTEIEA